MKNSSLVLIAFIVLVSGCVTLPFGQPTKQERPVAIHLDNSANTSHTFEVSVVELPANITTRINEDRVSTTPIHEGITSHNPGDNRTFSAVELPDSARLHGQYMLAAGETNETSIDDLPRRFAVVVTISRNEGEIVWYIIANCGGQALAGLEVFRTPDWVSVAHSCV